MRRETLVESRKTRLSLDGSVADALARAGQELASKTTWWGAEPEADDADDDEGSNRTVIRCTESSPGTYDVTVTNAVGLIAVGDDLQILVAPKIAESHFLHLLEASEFFPRGLSSKAHAGLGVHFWDLIAGWYAVALEQLMRRGIVLDYVGHEDPLPFVRGRVKTSTTALNYYQGRLEIDCEYEDFGEDTPLNRILQAAGKLVSSSRGLSPALRQRMRSILTRFDRVGLLEPGDLRAKLDRRTSHYADSLMLARHIIGGVYRVMSHGEHLVWTFLIPTPLMVETGVRRELEQRLAPEISVVKRSFPLAGSPMRMNPDLVFGDVTAVGDVKYKLFSGDWRRGDLNQIVAFAAAARTTTGIVVGFHPVATEPLPRIGVGDFHITGLSWRADPGLDPRSAADELAAAIEEVLPRTTAIAAA